MKPATSARIAGGLFLAEALFAVLHRALGGEYKGFTHLHNVVVNLGLAVIWGGAAVMCALHRTWPAFVWVLVATAASLVHGVMFSLATGFSGPIGAGIPFLLAAGIEAWCWVYAGSAFLEPAPAAPQEPGERRFWHRRVAHSH